MLTLKRELIQAVVSHRSVRYDLKPLQLGLGRCPWRVMVASMCLCRTQRLQVDRIVQGLFYKYPTPVAMSQATTEVLEEYVRPLGLWRNRARQLIRSSFLYTYWAFDAMEELPGVGKYVADAVRLYVFGHKELTCKDAALTEYALSYKGPSVNDVGLGWEVRFGQVTQCTSDPVMVWHYLENLRAEELLTCL